MMQTVRIRRASWADPEIQPPRLQTRGSAGADLRANLRPEMRTAGLGIGPGCWNLVPLGLFMEIPEGFEGQIRPRSGMGLKFGVTVLNSPGTIDSDFRGEVGVLLVNHGAAPFRVRHGDRIAQLVIAPAVQVSFEWSETISPSDRGAGGFGSTGTN